MYHFPFGPQVHDQSYQTFSTYEFCFNAKLVRETSNYIHV